MAKFNGYKTGGIISPAKIQEFDRWKSRYMRYGPSGLQIKGERKTGVFTPIPSDKITRKYS